MTIRTSMVAVAIIAACLLGRELRAEDPGAALPASDVLGKAAEAGDASAHSTAGDPASPDAQRFWVVALAWSPEFCRNSPEFHSEPQCAQAHGFVTSRLEVWQGQQPMGPCAYSRREPSDSVVVQILDSLYNRRWAEHLWNRYGGCSGLDVDEYFIKATYLGRRVVIPEQFLGSFGKLTTRPEEVQAAFSQANDGLDSSSIGVDCRLGWLSEVRVCVDQDYRYKSCARAVTASRCGEAVKVRGNG